MVVPVVLVHGGAGNIADDKVSDMVQGVKRAVGCGLEVLRKGGNSLDAAQACVEAMESDPVFNAGRGSVLNAEGEVEVDAIIMDGSTLNFGSVGAVRNILHPIALARRVMEKSRACMLVGPGAQQFARDQGFPITPNYDLVTAGAYATWEKHRTHPDTMKYEFQSCSGLGTVGAVVLDSSGRVACATSTGGTIGKPPGRLGDTPIPGGGGYANDAIGAVSATGRGESIMRVCLSHRILNSMERGTSAQEATEEALAYMMTHVGDAAGAITVSSRGDIGISFNSPRMAWACQRGDGPLWASVDKPENLS